MLLEPVASIPLRDAASAVLARVAIKTSTPGEAGTAGSDPPRRVLLIEDDLDIAEMYRFQLELDGYVVAVAHSGERGLGLARELPPELVLLDLRLPVMDGFQVLEAMKEDHQLMRTPVVILSNFGDPQMMERAQSFGVRDYLVKSRTTPEQISGQIPSWIGEEPTTYQ